MVALMLILRPILVLVGVVLGTALFLTASWHAEDFLIYVGDKIEAWREKRTHKPEHASTEPTYDRYAGNTDPTYRANVDKFYAKLGEECGDFNKDERNTDVEDTKEYVDTVLTQIVQATTRQNNVKSERKKPDRVIDIREIIGKPLTPENKELLDQYLMQQLAKEG
jgi:hypothetical protein